MTHPPSTDQFTNQVLRVLARAHAFMDRHGYAPAYSVTPPIDGRKST